MPQDSDKLPLAELKKRENELMNCQRDKSEKGSRELYTSGSNYSSTERGNVRIVRLFHTFGNYGRLLG